MANRTFLPRPTFAANWRGNFGNSENGDFQKYSEGITVVVIIGLHFISPYADTCRGFSLRQRHFSPECMDFNIIVLNEEKTQ